MNAFHPSWCHSLLKKVGDKKGATIYQSKEPVITPGRFGNESALVGATYLVVKTGGSEGLKLEKLELYSGDASADLIAYSADNFKLLGSYNYSDY